MGTLDENRKRWRREHRPGTPSRIKFDDELRHFIDANADELTYKALVEQCRNLFGPPRAPSRTAVGRYWKARLIERGLTKKKQINRFKISRDPHIKAFVDRLLPHAAFVAIADACREKFGTDRAPSKSTIHRYFHDNRKLL